MKFSTAILTNNKNQSKWKKKHFIKSYGLPRGLSGKESACLAGDMGLFSGLGRSSGEGNGNPFQYSCLGNPMDREAWWATVHEIAKSQT